MINKKTYYLWDLFPPEETENLHFIKDKFQRKFISPYFDLHITLSVPYLKIVKTVFYKLRSFEK